MSAPHMTSHTSPYASSTLHFQSRRSPLLAVHGVVASSQTLASQIGLQILQAGGNAADACVAVAAALNVTEPTSTGIGGDCFAIWYDAKTQQVSGLNGSGRTPAGLALSHITSAHRTGDSLNPSSVHCVTVPGAAQGWCDTIKQWGKLDMKQVLAPAIKLAKEGFPVAPITANSWAKGVSTLLSSSSTSELLISGTRAPHAGEIWKNPNLARTFEILAERGRDGFYTGEVAKAIVEALAAHGGHMTEEDLASHVSTHPTPISVNYHGIDVWEIPPNGQGITALMALNIIDEITKNHPISEYKHNGADYLHILIEAMRIAFADTRWYVADPDKVHVPIKELLSKEYARTRISNFSHTRANPNVRHGSPVVSSSTVSFCCVDGEGNSCSFINSNYMGFGTGFIPRGYGFTLQNRGANFSLDPNHPNVLAPNKRPYHTIIPGMATKNGQLYCPFSVMGGFNQPQGHVQVLLNMIDFGMDPQLALDQSRFCIESGEAGGYVLIEDVDQDTIAELKNRGHDIRGPITSYARSVFGRGQIIRRMSNGVLWGGSDGRADGAAVGY